MKCPPQSVTSEDQVLVDPLYSSEEAAVFFALESVPTGSEKASVPVNSPTSISDPTEMAQTQGQSFSAAKFLMTRCSPITTMLVNETSPPLTSS